jgi:hypothetical protein
VGEPIVAEAADGSVFYSSGEAIYVVDGDSPPVVALHPGATVLAMAAGSADLYVVTPNALVAFSRSTGSQVASWPLTASQQTPTSAGVQLGNDGTVWVWTDWATDSSGYEEATLYVIPAGSTQVSVISQEVEPGSLVADGSYAYFVQDSSSGAGANLVEWTPSAASPPGASVVGPSVGADELVAFSEGQVVLDGDNTSTGSTLAAYDPADLQTPGSGPTLATSVPAPAAVASMAPTGAGLLLLSCSGSNCGTVSQFEQSTGATTSTLAVTGADTLLGPFPAVVTVESGVLHLVRLS